MRNVWVVGALALAVILTTSARTEAAPATTKIGIIDLQRILNETKMGKAAKAKLEADKTDKQSKLNKDKEALQKEAAEFEKQAVVLKDDAKAKRQRELQDKFGQLQNTYMQLQQDLAKQEASLTKEIWGKAGSIVESIAKRDGYNIVVDRTEGGVFWSDKTVDFTDEVIKRLDAGEGGGGGGSSK